MNIICLKTSERDFAKSGLVPLSASRLETAKAAYNARRVDLSVATHLLQGDLRPRAGDLVLARVEAIGQHKRIELGSGRRAHLYVGNEIVVCYGARYAPDQFEAYVPDDLSTCSLVAAGGVAARYESKHTRMNMPTTIEPIGLLADRDGRRLNIADWSLPPVTSVIRRPHVIVVLGTAMNAGKTTTAANLVRGYKLQGKRVGVAKVTGTGAGGDRWATIDAGADLVLDFTDAGVPSTFGLDKLKVENIFVQLINQLAAEGAEVIVLEVADGLFQEESAALTGSRVFKQMVDDILFAAGDALGACAGVGRLREQELPVAAVSGSLTASPLAIREAQQALGLPVVTAQELGTGVWLPAQHDNPQVSLPVSESVCAELGRVATAASGIRYQGLQAAGAGA
jgi:hypothetical protein